MTCNNEVLKQLGLLQGIFGAEMDRIDGRIVVNHTDEITRGEISNKLDELGWKELTQQDDKEVPYDDPSIWGCAL
ncbi:MAG: hypothetical protein Q8T08_11870 [Ignavibacteria bacterium]|nr:hypothetical protein [Ignavibacteria bacterium]